MNDNDNEYYQRRDDTPTGSHPFNALENGWQDHGGLRTCWRCCQDTYWRKGMCYNPRCRRFYKRKLGYDDIDRWDHVPEPDGGDDADKAIKCDDVGPQNQTAEIAVVDGDDDFILVLKNSNEC